MKKNKHSLKISRSYFGETTLDGYSLACFDKGMGNKFLCQKCKDIALKDLGDKNIFLH